MVVVTQPPFSQTCGLCQLPAIIRVLRLSEVSFQDRLSEASLCPFSRTTTLQRKTSKAWWFHRLIPSISSVPLSSIFYMWILCCSKEWRMLPTSTQAPMKAFLSECPFRASSCRPVLGCHRFNAFTRGNLSAGHIMLQNTHVSFSALTVSRLPHRIINNLKLLVYYKRISWSQTPLTEIYPSEKS